MDEADKLWEFAVAVYEDETVKSTCLNVQARYGLSVSLLLGSIWTGIQGYGRLGATDLETTIRRSVEWHRDVIEPIRAVRRQLRQQPPAGAEEATHALRRQLVDAELDAERLEQRLFLEDFTATDPASAEPERWRDAAVNASLLTRKSCPRPEPEALDALARIIHAICPQANYADLYGEIENVWAVGQ
ncbi:TIGR02444 family protein [Alkalilimnicola ehrlichii]|uniref:TIGR02444 family protein n=1 Tax=Alkalilimnicola ehrlichii TaxID=351052 RepID=A0A3E0X292_9GAMM|nr:TIGR02444 family protein [Alkalilimnicola ehrlichii]RFA31106.1 TIGR02444 family protein [Alkalilimnicola ehrlichii]RFA39607.1 TIGR02444 family protein [Alkalilimnicola ehrlichii]